MSEANKWYDRENWPYEDDRKAEAAYAAWIKSIGWQLIATFTFGYRFSDDRASRMYDEFINCLENNVRSEIIYIRGDEKRFSGCGKPGCSRHYHVLMTCAAPLDPFFVECLWKDIAGHRHDGADVRRYNPELEGVGYVLKMMHKQHGDWKAKGLHLVVPMDQSSLRVRTRRALKRHAHRVKLHANTEPVKCTPKWDSNQHKKNPSLNDNITSAIIANVL